MSTETAVKKQKDVSYPFSFKLPLLKICVTGFSGNTGKTTTSDALSMYIPDVVRISVESINAGAEGDSLRGGEFGRLQEHVQLSDAIIVDVGASNVEDYISLMEQYRGSHEDYDYFVIPVTRERKQVEDVIATIRALEALGVPSNKIKVVFNKMKRYEDVEDVFAPIVKFWEATKSFDLRLEARLEENEVYQQLRGMGLTLADLLNDKTDWVEVRKSTDDKQEKLRAVKMIGLKRLAESARDEQEKCIKALGL